MRMERYATHLPLLTSAVVCTKGPVFEMGCGYYSTPVLHSMCLGRKLYSADSDESWFNKFAHLETPKHKFILVGDWNDMFPIVNKCGLVFIDGPPHARSRIFSRAVNSTIVVHDTNFPAYKHNWKLYKFRYDYKEHTPWTSLASNNKEVFNNIVRLVGRKRPIRPREPNMKVRYNMKPPT